MIGRSSERGKRVSQSLFLLAAVSLVAAGCGGELAIDSEQSALERFATQLEKGNYREACQELEDLCSVKGFACSAYDLFCEGAEYTREGICERMGSACQEQGVGCETQERTCGEKLPLNGDLCDDDVCLRNSDHVECEEDPQGCCNAAVCFEGEQCGEADRQSGCNSSVCLVGEDDQQGCCNSSVCLVGEDDQQGFCNSAECFEENGGCEKPMPESEDGCCNSAECFEEDGRCECQGDCNSVKEPPQQLD